MKPKYNTNRGVNNPCGKKSYDSKSEAKRQLKKLKLIPGKILHVYYCIKCEHYHIGNTSYE